MNYPPPGPPPAAGWPPSGWQPPPAKPPAKITWWMVLIGPFVYSAVNIIVGFVTLWMANQVDDGSAVLMVAAIMLIGFAFGLGGVLLIIPNPYARGLGLGLMVGWALTSVVTLGICTGVNPDMYGAL